MTKCVLRELENLPKDTPWVKETLKACQGIVKLPCKHTGGILPPDECIKNFVGSKNEAKVFVASNDSDLRNHFRNNVGTVPLFFFQSNVLVMDAPSEVSQTKFELKEQLKLEPTRAEKKFLKAQKSEVEAFLKEEEREKRLEQKKKTKDLLVMGVQNKMAKGPNPLSILKKSIKKPAVKVKVKKRRFRKGIRSKKPREALV